VFRVNCQRTVLWPTARLVRANAMNTHGGNRHALCFDCSFNKIHNVYDYIKSPLLTQGAFSKGSGIASLNTKTDTAPFTDRTLVHGIGLSTSSNAR